MEAGSTLTRLLPQIRSRLQCPSLSVRVMSEWGAKNNPEYRLAIRRALHEEFQEADLLDLHTIPHNEKFSLSVSHSTEIGGFAYCEQPLQVGFDLELASRIQERTMARMSTSDELKRAPSPAHLWTAKEAAYKSLKGCGQPSVLSAIKIERWNELPVAEGNGLNTVSIWEYRASIGAVQEFAAMGRGLLIFNSPYLFAFFIFPAQLRSRAAEE